VKNSHFLDFVEAGRNPGNLEVRFAPQNQTFTGLSPSKATV
jgi:hypothetical protein